MTLALLLVCCLGLPAEIPVEADTVTLGAILPLAPGDPRAAVSMGFAPNPGVARRFLKQEIVTRVSAAGHSMEGLELPDAVSVRRVVRNVSNEAAMGAILDALIRQYPDGAVDVISVEVPPTPAPSGSFTVTATLPARIDPSAPIYPRLEVRGGSVVRSAVARAVVRVETVQPILRTAVSARSPLRPEDIEWKLAPIRTGPAPVPRGDLQGMAARRDLEAGDILTTDMLYAPIAVQRGETVLVRSSAGGVTISATMRAKGSGKIGDSISVEHLTGGGSTTARIVGPQLLEVLSERKTTSGVNAAEARNR